MYAVIKTGGKQYRVKEGDELLIEKIEGNAGQKVKIEEVLMVKDENGVHLGKELEGAYVEAEILGMEKGEKIIVFKYRAKKRYRRKTGHRQQYTKIRIEKIHFSGKGKKAAKRAEEPEAAAS